MSRKPIKIESTDKVLSARGGLHLFDHLYNTLGLEKALAPYMPAYKIATKTSAADKFRALCLAFIAEAECLDDVERRRTDAAFHASRKRLAAGSPARRLAKSCNSCSRSGVGDHQRNLLISAVDVP